jgi:hypothetical protein
MIAVGRNVVRPYTSVGYNRNGPQLRKDKQINELLDRIVKLPEDNRPHPLVSLSILHDQLTRKSVHNKEVSFVNTFRDTSAFDDY